MSFSGVLWVCVLLTLSRKIFCVLCVKASLRVTELMQSELGLLIFNF